MSRRLTTIIANSRFTAVQLVKLGVPASLVEVIPNAVSVPDTIARAREQAAKCAPLVPDERPVILVAHALVEPGKGTETAVRSFAALVGEGLGGELWIAGDVIPSHAAYAQHVRQLVDALAIAHRVRFLGKRDDIFAVMSQADIVVVPSLFQEAFGLVAAEAMALGKAVAVSDRGALPDLVEDRVSGRVFRPEHPSDLVQVLRQLMCDAGLRASYGMAARQRIALHYDPEVFARRVVAVFGQVVARR